jgi:hypothetical protein
MKEGPRAMGSRKKARLRQRRAAGEPLKVAIVTAPSSGSSGVSLARDVELVKAAALYADEIELVSVGAVMIAGAAQLAGGGHQALLALIASLDDDTLRHLGGGKDMPANWREVLAVLSRPDASLPPEAAELARGLRASMAEAQEDLAGTAEKMLVDSGAGELLPAIGSGLVTLSASGFTDDTAADTDAVMENWLALLRGLLVDKRTRLVLDDQVGSLAASLIREGHVDPHRLTLRHAGEAAIGSGLVARLPAFPGAPLNELLDLRSDLAGPLGGTAPPPSASAPRSPQGRSRRTCPPRSTTSGPPMYSQPSTRWMRTCTATASCTRSPALHGRTFTSCSPRAPACTWASANSLPWTTGYPLPLESPGSR